MTDEIGKPDSGSVNMDHERPNGFLPQSRENPLALSVVVPCFNEEESIETLYGRVSAVAKKTTGESYELVLIDDGSTDATWSRILALQRRDAHVIGVRLSRNHGHQLALSAGMNICAGERILIVDADLQDPPEILPDMMAEIDRGADVVYGQRSKRKGESLLKKASAAYFYRLLDWLSDVSLPVDSGDFRLMSRRALNIVNDMPERYRYVRGMVSWIGLKQVPIRYERQERFAGETKYPLRRMIRFALDAITSFSIVPLRMASYLGLFIGLLGALITIYVFWSWLVDRTVPGWTSVMMVVLILGSVQLFVIGVLGEYLGRLYIESKERPLYIIDEVVRAPGPVRSAGPPGQKTTTANAPAQSPSSPPPIE